MTADWAGTAAAYHRSFARLCAGAVAPLLDALEALGAAPTGGRLLDAGSGTGVVAEAAVGRGWRVDAVDLDPGMTAFAAARLPTVAHRTADVAALPEPDSVYDAVAAGFCLNHADHPQRVAAELRRVAAPGAPLAATVWPWEPTEMNALWHDIMSATGTRPERFALPAGTPFERTEDGLAGLLRGAGWREVHVERLGWTFEIEPAALWLGVEAGIATIGQAYAGADDAGRDRIRGEYARRVAERVDGGMLRFRVSAILAAGLA